MRTHAFLVINRRSGRRGPSPDELAAAAQERGIETHLLAAGEDPAGPAGDSGAEVIGVAGGDGSLAAVAAVAIERDAAFVCVPFGTRNHFARDVGLDHRDPMGTLAAFANGAERRIDVGRVGDRLFLNNVSLGAYAGLVHRRERHRRRREALARVRALVRVLGNRHQLQAAVGGEPIEARVLLVGNNHYELDLFTLGARDRLDAGELHLWAAAGWLPTAWEERRAPRFRIDLPPARVRAAIDGEPAMLEPPLELESMPRALRLRVPNEGGAMHDNPEASDAEQEEAHEGRQQEEESMRYPEHQDPDEQRERAHRDPDRDE